MDKRGENKSDKHTNFVQFSVIKSFFSVNK